MVKTRVGILRGGVSGEYDVSLKTGASVLRQLPEKYKGVDIVVDKLGTWHFNGVARSPERIFPHMDVVFNALHGYWGEDGKVQKLLDQHGVRYTGSEALASAIGMNKIAAKNFFTTNGLLTPAFTTIARGEDIEARAVELFRAFHQPSVVKAATGGSSIGVGIAKNFRQFKNCIYEALYYSNTVLIEEMIEGREATCAVVDNFRDTRHYAFPPIEIIPPPTHSFFDYESKYDGSTREVCPAHFPLATKRAIERAAIAAHKTVGARHYSRSDFIVSPRGIYILEINTLPGLTEASLLPKACAAVGLSLPNFLDHVVSLALTVR